MYGISFEILICIYAFYNSVNLFFLNELLKMLQDIFGVPAAGFNFNLQENVSNTMEDRE